MNGRIITVLLLAIFVAMLGLGIIGPLMPVYAKNLGATGFLLGLIFSVFSISRLIFMPFIGKVSDRVGRKLFISVGLLIYTMASIGYIFSKNVYELVGIRFVHGFASAMVLPIAMAYIAEISPKGREGAYMGFFNTSFFLGMGLGPFLGGFLTDYSGKFQTAFISMGILTAVALILVLLFLPERKKTSFEPAKSVSFRSMLRNKIVRGLFVFRSVSALGRASVMAFLPLLAINMKISTSQVGLLISLAILTIAIMQWPFGKLSDRMGRVPFIIFGSTIGAIALILMPSSKGFFPILSLCIIMGLGGSISMPAASALIAQAGRKTGMGSTMGLFNMAMSLGMITAPLISGILMDVAGIKSVFYFGGSISLLSIVIFWFMVRGESSF